MKKQIQLLLFAWLLLAPSMLYGQTKKSFTPITKKESKLDSLITIYQQQGMDKQAAYQRAVEELSGEGVTTRYAIGTGLTRPSTPGDSSIRVDRDSLIHTYTPSELIKKILLKAKKPSFARRIRNVQFVGAGGDGTTDQTVWKKDHVNLPDFMIEDENRSLSYFEGDPQGLFPLVEGLLLSTGETHAVEGPNQDYQGIRGGVNPDLEWEKSQSFFSFDADASHTKILGSAAYNPHVINRHTLTGGLVEFDFSPASTEIYFDYIFGSEEYSNGVWNRSGAVFGFYVSGPFDEPPAGSPVVTYDPPLADSSETRPLTSVPYTSMAGVSATQKMNTVERGMVDGKQVKKYIRYNIALLPNGDPVGVNSVNWGRRNQGYVNLPMGAWNLADGEYVYPDKIPFDAEPDEQGFATNLAPHFIESYKALYDNSIMIDPIQGHLKDQKASLEWRYYHQAPPPGVPAPPPPPFNFEQNRGINMVYFRPIPIYHHLTEMNGLTIKLTAKADSLIPNKWYHLKLVVAQPFYGNGSVVFLSDLDLGEMESTLDPIPEKEGAGWDASWDTTYAAADNPIDPEGRFPLYSGCDRTFSIIAKTPLPGASYLVLKREGIAENKMNLLLNGVPMTSNSILLKEKTNNFKITVQPLPVSAEQEGEVGVLSAYMSLTSVVVDTILYYTAYNHPTTKIRYSSPTIGYAGKLDLGIQGGSPSLFRSMDGGKNWVLASEPVSARDIDRVRQEDSVKLWLRAPNCSCEDIIVPISLSAEFPNIIRTITLQPLAHATMNKTAGIHHITTGENFEFIITPHADHADKELIIRTNRKIIKDDQGGLLVTKRDDGSYHVVIKNVTENLDISFDMVVANEASIKNGSVWSRGAQLFVHATVQEQVAVYTLSGTLTTQFALVAGETRSLSLPAGVYLVRLKETGEVYKAIIK